MIIDLKKIKGSPLTNLATSAAFGRPAALGQAKRKLDFDAEKSAVPLKISGLTVRPAVSLGEHF